MKFINICILLITTYAWSASEEKTAVFILGMHRSGTSATAGTLNLLDLYLGNSLLGKANANPKGHFEDIETLQLNKAFLTELGTTWFDLEPLKIDWNSIKAAEFKERIKAVWSKNFFTHQVFGVKEPRMCLLLPLYIDVAREAGYKLKFVVVRRDFREIATSLTKRGKAKLPWEHAFHLAEKYTAYLDAFLKQFKIPYIEIQFNDLVNNTEPVINKIKQFLPMLNYSNDKREMVINFIDKDLKHHTV